MDKCFLQVLTSGNIIAPFVRATSQERGVLGGRSQRDFKKGEDNRRVVLIKGGQVRVLLSFSGGSKGHLHSDGSSPEWLPATVLRLGNVLSVRQALDSLKGSDSRWKEGWSTDRGMVYVVFGHPDRTRTDRYGETWIFGEEGDVNALIFRFSNRASGDDFNVYQLERYPGFRSPWEAMVSSWRRGKIRRR